MRTRSMARILVVISVLVSAFWAGTAVAQESPPAPAFKTQELDQMLAPIALYPDDVLANVLMASTYPLEVVQAARWREEPANAKLKGEDLTKALEGKTWDPSVKSLTQFPDILKLMSKELEWTQKLGDAFLAQEDDVFGRIQYLRQKADESGHLKSTKKQKITKKEKPSGSSSGSASSSQSDYYYVIEPIDPEYIYVPVYEPSVVYGSWWYPSYPPYYWDWYPGSTLVSGIFWGAGFAIANNIWNWGHFDWDRGDINIDVDRFNKINVKGDRITDGRWQHNPKHRGPVPYKDKVSRDKFGKSNKFKDASKDFRGFDKDKAGQANVDRVKDKLGTDGASKIKDKVGDGGASKLKDKMSDGGADRIKDKLGNGGASKIKDKAGDRGGQKIKDKVASRDKPATRDIKKGGSKGAAKSFDVKPKAQVKKNIDRGSVSRKSAASRRGGGGAKFSGGGGGRSFGGGGGRRGGGGGRGGGRRSDIRLKTDIVPLAQLNNGLQLYRFRYKGSDHTAYVGVIAQEVQKVNPGAVTADRKGFLRVDYDRIGVKFMTWNAWRANKPVASSVNLKPVSASERGE